MTDDEILRCVRHLEAHGGVLIQCEGKVEWQDGSVSGKWWQYSAGDHDVPCGHTAMEAVQQHMEGKGWKT